MIDSVWLLALSWLPPCAQAPEPGAAPEIGARVADLELLDTRFLPRSLSSFRAERGWVLFFTTLDCPVSRRYLPRLVEMEPRWREKGFRFLAVDVGPSDSILGIAAQAVEVGAAFPFVKDVDGEAARALGVERTSHAVVLDAERRLRYRGRVDDQFRYGGARPTAGRRDLELALEQLHAGEEIEVTETVVDGCRITRLEPPEPRPVDWATDVAPLLREKCTGCHLPGGIGPFRLDTYVSAASHASMVAEVVAEGRMPPWFAAPGVGAFANDPSLTEEEVRLVQDWLELGAPRGDPGQEPPPLEESGPWRGGEPDLVLTMEEEIHVPATGFVPYRYVKLPYVFEHDTWVESIEIMPENRRVLHHANLVRLNDEDPYKDLRFLAGYEPGSPPTRFGPGIGLRIPTGCSLALQLHYVTTGTPETDRVRVGLRFPRGLVRRQARHLFASERDFVIPPEAPAHEVRAEMTFVADATGLGIFPHMHLRGRDVTFEAVRPDGRRESLLVVPSYSFDWQLTYRWAPETVRFPAGTRIEVVGHYDNSDANPYNPDPRAEVRYGERSIDEMFDHFLYFTFDDERLSIEVDPRTGRVLSGWPVEAAHLREG